MKTVNLRPHLKRNILIAAVLLLVCAAAFLNWSYNQRWGDGNSAMADAEDEMTTAVNAAVGTPEETASEALPASVSGYFSEARLTRQQARDSALSLLQEASGAAEVDEAAAAEAAQSIQTLAAYTLAEAQIENMITAKGYDDCVTYINDGVVCVAVSAPADGLSDADAALISDIVTSQTDYSLSQVRIIEVKP